MIPEKGRTVEFLQRVIADELFFECRTCGALIDNTDLHAEWHEGQENTEVPDA